MPQKLNAKGRPFSWSHSSRKDFINCPLRYAHAKFYCTTPWQDTEAIRWGNRVHKMAEKFLKAEGPLKDLEALKPVEKYCEAFLRSGNRIEAELEISLDRDFVPVSWFSKKAWVRAKIDVVVTKRNNTTGVHDWKTGGKVRHDPDQINTNFALLQRLRPQVQEFYGGYIWTTHQKVTPVERVLAKDVPKIWQEILIDVERMEEAWETETFQARPSGLCPWCQVENCKDRRGARRY